MLRSIGALCALAILAGCSGASAAAADPNNDVHCFALATGFSNLTKFTKAPADQQHATAVLEAWYGPRFDAVVKAHGKDSVLAEAQSIAQAMDTDFMAMKDAYMACVERAVADPKFRNFATQAARR